MPATARPRRTPCPFGFTIRLTETQRIHFEGLAQAQGHSSIAAAFKAQALASGMEHPLQEMRLSLDYMTSRITDESAWLDQHVVDLARSVNATSSLMNELLAESQSCTQAMILFAQSTEALSKAISKLGQPPMPLSTGHAPRS